MTRVLVTGGTGFIGRALLARLLQRGDRVRCLLRGARRDRTRPDLLRPQDVEYMAGDVLDPASLERALADVQVVYHLAGATVVRSWREFALGNDVGNRNVAEACAAPSRPVVVYVSSLAAAGPAGWRTVDRGSARGTGVRIWPYETRR